MRQLRKLVVLIPLLAWAAGFSTTPPFNECPAVGSSTSCAILHVFNADGSVSAFGDATQTPYDGSNDTLVGVLNNSGKTQTSLTLSGVGSMGVPVFEFDADGICTFTFAGNGLVPSSSYCSGAYYRTDPGDYAGPNNTFSNISADQKTGTIVFTGGLAPGAATYFSLEDRLSTSAPPIVVPPGSVAGVPTLSTTGLVLCGILLVFAASRLLRRGTSAA